MTSGIQHFNRNAAGCVTGIHEEIFQGRNEAYSAAKRDSGAVERPLHTHTTAEGFTIEIYYTHKPYHDLSRGSSDYVAVVHHPGGHPQIGVPRSHFHVRPVYPLPHYTGTVQTDVFRQINFGSQALWVEVSRSGQVPFATPIPEHYSY